MSNEHGTGTEAKARRANQECDNHHHSDGFRQSGCDGAISQPGEQVRTDNKNCLGSNSALRWSLAGGILDQLIADAEDQLEKTRACIEWYQQEEKEREQRLDNLKRLRELARQKSEIEE